MGHFSTTIDWPDKLSGYRLPPTWPLDARSLSEEGGLEPTGNLPNASEANLCSLSDRGGPFEGGGCIPTNARKARSCHGQLRRSSKCVSALKSTATSRPSF